MNNLARLAGLDPGVLPHGEKLSGEMMAPYYPGLCRKLGIEPGQTWILEISKEGVLQFTRPLTDEERTTLLAPVS